MTVRQAEALVADDDLRATLKETLSAADPGITNPAGVTAVALAVIDAWLRAPLPGGPAHQFTHAHLRLVFLLAENSQGTHHQLRRLWDAKATRAGDLAWPMISDSGVRTRCSELVRWGLVEATGARGRTPAGGQSRIWSLAADPRRLGRGAPVPGIDDGAVDVYLRLRDEAGDNLVIRSSLELAASVAGIRA